MALFENDRDELHRKRMVFTGREEAILELAAQGLTDRSISIELGISHATVATYWRRILLRYGSSKRTEVVAAFVKQRATAGIHQDNVELRNEISARTEAQALELAYRNLLEAVTQASMSFISGRASLAEVARNLLDELLSITASEYGFIGEVVFEGTIPYLRTHAITDISWNEETAELYRTHQREGLEFRNLQTLFGKVMTTGKVVIANEPATDPRRGGLPSGHPELNSFLGIPVYAAEEIVGMIGIANRPNGYDRPLIEFLSPLTAICSNMIASKRSEERRRVAQDLFATSNSLVHSLVDQLPSKVMFETADRRLAFINKTFAKRFLKTEDVESMIGIDSRKARDQSLSLFADPNDFVKRSEQLILAGQNVIQEPIIMADGRILERDFVVVRADSSVRGYLWVYRDITNTLLGS